MSAILNYDILYKLIIINNINIVISIILGIIILLYLYILGLYVLCWNTETKHKFILICLLIFIIPFLKGLCFVNFLGIFFCRFLFH
jgi:hypothetical protein